ncbi:MAG: succinate dehydrogenase / fumarate reductase cytochrome b subunit [Candidatus Midichloriaceae bacterium]|jgi:succinate dehydrogenase / fumarate reductase cytochrome b subunit
MNQSTRPLSPHLGIYKPQITSVLSIMHRITGVLIFFGFLIILWVLNYYTFDPMGIKTFKELLSFIYEKKVYLSILILWSYCIFYHMCAGIRYLFWDIGKGMELKTVTISGIFVIVFSILLTAGFWYYIISK